MPTRFDREHALTFARFLWQRFVDDKCFETAGALSYTTLFALVPLTASVFGILSAFPVFSTWTTEVTDFVFRNFVPAAGATVRQYVLEFANNASKMTAVGIVALLASALLMMSAIEDRLNRIWRVQARRSSVSRFLLYWVALTLGPLLVVGGLAASSYIFALPVLSGAAAQVGQTHLLLRALPFLVTLVSLLLLYTLVPNRHVALRHAGIGALLAAILFEVARSAFAMYVRTVPSYEQVYGALAVVPIFLIWIFVSWVIVLLGASIAASLSSFDYRPKSERLPEDAAFLGLLHVLAGFVEAQRAGRALDADALCARVSWLSDDLLERYLDNLQRAALVERSETGDWMLIHSLDTASLTDVYETGAYRLPLDAAVVTRWSAGLPASLRELLERMRESLRAQLATPLARAYPLGEHDAASTTMELPS